jgi:hypothetical protein
LAGLMGGGSRRGGGACLRKVRKRCFLSVFISK